MLTKVVLSVSLLAPVLCSAVDSVEVESELRAAYEDDQHSRSPDGPTEPCGDEKRRARVLDLLADTQIQSPSSKYFAAMILQHTPQGIVDNRVVSASPENYLLAYFLAKSAAAAGHEGAKQLAATALDRYLVSQRKPQKFGTQFQLNLQTARLEFSPVDPATTDAERAEWNVPPIDVTLRNFRNSGMADRVRKLIPLSELGCAPNTVKGEEKATRPTAKATR